jgi:hypothetical protein
MSASRSPFPDVPERIAEILFVLCQTLTMRLRAATVTQAQLTYVVGRLLGIRKRFLRLVERIRAGHPPKERARKPRAIVPEPEAEFPLGFRPPPPGWRRWAVRPNKPVPLWRSLRQDRFAWLLPLAPNVPAFRDSAAGLRAGLLGLLAEPEAQAFLLTSRRVGDSLRPLCWMLGIESSILYPARPAPDQPAAGAAVVSVVDPVSSADNPMPDPVRDKTACSPFATRIIATAEPILGAATDTNPARPRARDDDELFAIS